MIFSELIANRAIAIIEQYAFKRDEIDADIIYDAVGDAYDSIISESYRNHYDFDEIDDIVASKLNMRDRFAR